jgi:hypothetical protein
VGFFLWLEQLIFTEGQVLVDVDFQLQRIHRYTDIDAPIVTSLMCIDIFFLVEHYMLSIMFAHIIIFCVYGFFCSRMGA